MTSSGRFFDPWIKRVLDLFRQGLFPREIGLSITIGFLVGIMPLFGVTTILVTFLAFYLRLELLCGLSGWGLGAIPLGFLLYLVIWKTILLCSKSIEKDED